ncbi:hypothetical protein [Pseudomonas frederiksbergensis]|uniref:hypothetical protein n=1 Tax=Pseudomonas frederiksbergensis TaxID=104087 RepID=UPI003D22A53B
MALISASTVGADARGLQTQFGEKTMDHPAAGQSQVFRPRNFCAAVHAGNLARRTVA